MSDPSEARSMLRQCCRSLFFSNLTTETFSERATPEQAQFLLEMMSFEIGLREENKRRRLLKRASFPALKTLAGYDLSGVRLPPQLTYEEMASCDFIRCSKNLVLFGPVGTGKTHLAIALGMIACDMGLGVRFFTVSELVQRLTAAKAEGSLPKALSDILKSELIILDELGYVPIDRDGARLLFQVIADSYERRSLIVTTNVEFSRWGSILTDDQMAAAMIDRLAHHGHLIVFEGESYRMRNALMRQ